MGLRDALRAIREYPSAHAELETARFELRQAQQNKENRGVSVFADLNPLD